MRRGVCSMRYIVNRAVHAKARGKKIATTRRGRAKYNKKAPRAHSIRGDRFYRGSSTQNEKKLFAQNFFNYFPSLIIS